MAKKRSKAVYSEFVIEAEELLDDMRLSHDSPGDLCLQSGAGLGELLQKLDVSTALSPGLCPCQHPRIHLACRGSCPGGLPG